jgi:hypothetical protein
VYRSRVILALTVMTVGLLWIGQGMGLLQGRSFMVGDVRWALAGAVVVGIGATMALRARRDRPS